MCSIIGFEDLKEEKEFIRNCFDKTEKRGPDGIRFLEIDNAYLGFRRLSIMDLTESGMQPFILNGNAIVCNGEIYGFRRLKEELCKEYVFKSDSDCEILLPLYNIVGFKMFAMLDAEYALIMYDSKLKKIIAARDPIGIRPLYYGISKKTKKKIFASEPKVLIDLVSEIYPFPPGCYYDGEKIVRYKSVTNVEICKDDFKTVLKKIHDKLEKGVIKRLDADANIGFLLSGGLDSSLVCSIATKYLKHPIETYSIGMDTDAIDLKYAREVANYLKTNHHEIIIDKKDVINSLREVIYTLGSYDITTVRASIGMYLICKAISNSSEIKVLLTGEISDELFGYKYTDFAPSPEEFQNEARKRIEEVHMYDVLRADRCISANSLEARVPFGDLDFVKYVMSIDPKMKINTYNKGKYLLRKAFEGNYLPYDILYREKAAFSDAVGHSMVDYLKEYAESFYSDFEYNEKIKKYRHARPFTKESLLYREIFESFYPNQSKMIKDFWMPNKSWNGCNVNDPSARVLSNYGDSSK